jgi:hypothetical protein
MNDKIPVLELPELATLFDRLASNIELAQDAVSLRVGYQVEIAILEPFERGGGVNVRIFWRRQLPNVKLAHSCCASRRRTKITSR